jgi:serine protease Do
MHSSGLRSLLVAWTIGWGVLAVTVSNASAQEAKPAEQPAAVGQPEATAAETDAKRRELQVRRAREAVAQKEAAQRAVQEEQEMVHRLKFARDRYTLRLNAVLAGKESLIGIETAPVDDVLRSHLGLPADKGVLVTAVTENGPAAQGGIVKNDVLILVREQEIAGPAGLDTLLKDSVDKATSIAAIRKGQRVNVTVTPKSVRKIEVANEIRTTKTAPAQPGFWLGVGLAPVDDTLRSHLALDAGTGVVVTSVEKDSPAVKAGVLVNDVLLKLDGKPHATVESLAAHIQEIAEKSVPLELLRHGKPAMLTVTIERRPVAYPTEFNQTMFYRLSPDVSVTAYPVEAYVGVLPIKGYVNNPPAVQRQIAELLEQVQSLQRKLVELEAALKAPAAEQAPAGGK